VPRLPVDGQKVSELRITFGTLERELLRDLSTSYRIQAVAPALNDAAKILEDPLRIIQIAYGIATTLELFGIETGLPTPADLPELYEWITQRDITGNLSSSTGNPSIFQMVSDFLTGTGEFEGTWPGGY